MTICTCIFLPPPKPSSELGTLQEKEYGSGDFETDDYVEPSLGHGSIIQSEITW